LEAQSANILGNTFISAACVAYLGAFTRNYRNELISDWIEKCKLAGIPVSNDFSLVGILSDPVQVRDWNVSLFV
jgi:dynein heavy chain